MARVGRGRPASRLLVGAGVSARAGALVGSGGGSGALSVAPALNLVNDPQFDAASVEWGTSGFSLVAGASPSFPGGGLASFVPSAVDQGINYPPPGLGTFLAGTRYYASIKVRHIFDAATVELVLGSTSDDYASATLLTTGSFQTLSVSWVPQQDRSASNHGLALRYKGGAAFFPGFEVDDALISTAAGSFWAGWRTAGKGAARAVTNTGGGDGALSSSALHGAAITGAGGGSGALTVRRGGLSALTGSAGGSPALTTSGAHAGSVSGSGGGSGTFTRSIQLLPPAGLMGGGGRVGRGHPARGVVTAGAGATVASTAIFERSGSMAGTGGGSGAVTVTRGALSRAAGTMGGAGALGIAKGGRGVLVGSSGGSGALAGAATPVTGGIVGTFLMGGGGRVGRSHPAVGVIPRGRVLLGAFSADNRSGSLAASGGGTVTASARKGALSSTATPIPAPPPIMVDVLAVAGIRATGGGSFAYSYTRSASRVGAVTGTAGGSSQFTAIKKVAGALTGSGGGSPALTVRKGASSTITATSGGSFAYSYSTFEARTGSLAASGGGSATLRASKQGQSTITGSGGGSSANTSRRGTASILAGTGGGSFTYAYVVGGLAAVGTVTGTAGGTGAIISGKSPQHTIAGTGGGTYALRMAKGATAALTVTGGGAGTFRVVGLSVPVIGFGWDAPAGRVLEPVNGRLLSVATAERIGS